MLTESWLGQRMQFGQLKRREFITLLGGAGEQRRWAIAHQAPSIDELSQKIEPRNFVTRRTLYRWHVN
jgi:hypothetical protein